MVNELPLSGVRVVEMSHMVMGPTCGMILAQLGAEVIKVEPPQGDKTRTLGGMGAGFFPLFNRGKKSVMLDLSTVDGREAMYRLLGTADVFLENFRDGLLEKQGLGTADLDKRFPDLIIAGHKGFLSGPYEHRPALDEVVQMMSGLAAMTGTKAKPLRVGSSANDIMGGMFGVIAILAALYRKRETGKGANIRVGLFENCLFLVAQHMVQYEMTGVAPLSFPEREHAWPVYDIFETKEGQKLFIGVVTEQHWLTFCREFDLKELADDASLKTTTDRIFARPRILPLVAERVKQETIADLSAKLDRLNICFSPINRPEDLFDDPHVLRPGGLVSARNADGEVIRIPTLPLELDGSGIGEDLQVPALGADNEAVLAELGLGPEAEGSGMTSIDDIYPEGRVVLREVGLRDGLQLVKNFPSTADKRRWMEQEYEAGVRHFEVGSFLPASRFPQFADVLEIVATVGNLRGAHGIALVLNDRGAREAIASGVAEIGCVVSATEEHSLANTHRSRDASIADLKRLCDMRDDCSHRPIVNAGIPMALGCSIAGDVDPDEVVRLAERCFEAGADAVGVADTVGYAGPRQVGELTQRIVRIAAGRPVVVHLHDTRGMGIVNASAALDAGARILDGSLGGLGGCPFAPGATGNVVFEDLVFLLESKGFDTGIDMDRLLAVRAMVEAGMPSEAFYGGMARAGLPGKAA